MCMAKIIKVQNTEVTVKTSQDNNDYVSLTDMAKSRNKESPDQVIANWMRTNFTLQFLGLWEIQNNPNFNPTEFEGFRNKSGENSFVMSPTKWIKSTKAIGIKSSAGRYGGTFAHIDIALEFASWLSPEFKLYIIKEFRRLREIEKNTIHSIEWEIKRSIVKTNYKIHTNAIQKQLQNLGLTKYQESLRYAEEADLLNLIMFGQKAKEWEILNPNPAKQGQNMRDVATIEQLIVLSGLETLNAYLINQGITKNDRITALTREAIQNLQALLKQKSVQELKKLSNSLPSLQS